LDSSAFLFGLGAGVLQNYFGLQLGLIFGFANLTTSGVEGFGDDAIGVTAGLVQGGADLFLEIGALFLHLFA